MSSALSKQARINHTVFSEISANPLLSQCQAAACAAKLVPLRFHNQGGRRFGDGRGKSRGMACNQQLQKRRRADERGTQARPAAAGFIGTTAGSGSEVTLTAVLTMDKTGHKKEHNPFKLLC